MARLSKRRTLGVAFAAGLTFGVALLVTDSHVLGRPTPDAARAALAECFPELRDAPVSSRDGVMRVGDYSCEWKFGRGRWRGTWRYAPLHEELRVGTECPGGEFQRPVFGRWRAVETERFVVVSIHHRLAD